MPCLRYYVRFDREESLPRMCRRAVLIMRDAVERGEKEYRRIQLRKLYVCRDKRHRGKVVWTIKTMGMYCPHDTIQPECRKFCCECCPKVHEERATEASGELRPEEEREEILRKIRT